MRHKNSNHIMSPSEIGDCLLQTQNSSWDYVLDNSGSLEDISLKKVEQSIDRINQRGYHIPKDALDFLRKNRLLRDGKLTFAAEMLFAKDWHINTAVHMGFFQTPTIIKDKDETHGDLVSQVDQIFNFVKKHINCAVVITGKPENDLVWDYPLDALREIILNMIVHRDYRSPSESCVKVFADHIEFFNPGQLLDDMSIDDLVSDQYLSTLRNKAIANHFHQLGEIEKYGSGITRVINLFRNAGLNPPKFEIMGSGLKVTIFSKNGTPATTDKATDKTTDKTTNKKSTQILDAIRKNPSITNEELAKIIGNITIDGIRYHINKMKKANRIVRRNGKKEGYWEILD